MAVGGNAWRNASSGKRCRQARRERPDSSAAAIPRPRPGPRARHPGVAAPAPARRKKRRPSRSGSWRRSPGSPAARGSSPPRLRRLLRGGRLRLGPRRPGLGFLARPPRDGRLGRGQLALDFRAGQPEPHAAAADKRADLDPQISLLAEHEVTRLVTPVSALAARIASRPRPTRYSGRSPWTSPPIPCSMSPRRRIRKRSSTEARAT